MQKLKNKVVVAMSGGVDSSVAAALLKKQGFDIVGVFMKFWSEKGGVANRCCSPETEKRARNVALKLNIPFYVFNFEKEFKKRIVDYFLKEYRLGRTPNPCVVCNKEIKFGLLLEKALSLGASHIATGHYARVLKKKESFRLLMAKDKEKDQSYFLWQLNQKQLGHILFPVGAYNKTQVRRLVKSFRLPVYNIPDSQEVCFVQSTTDEFLKRYLKTKPGKIADSHGKVLGQHQGVSFYTIGQRKGIGLAGGPYYILNKDLENNILVVTKKEKDLLEKELVIKDISWVSGKEPKLPIKIKAKIRYRHKASSGSIQRKVEGNTYKIKFISKQRAITSGQSVVFYRGDELLGGGIIN